MLKKTIHSEKKETKKKESDKTKVEPKAKVQKTNQSSEPPIVKKKPEKTNVAKNVNDNVSLSNKDYLVEEFSLRWNYVLPAYPPTSFNYQPSLLKNKLNLVTSE